MADDTYLAIAEIATDANMTERMRAAATQQAYLGSAPAIGTDGNPFGLSVLDWVANNRYVWAASPGWGAAWDSALAAHPPDTEPEYEPGRDAGVITDGMILATVQKLGGAPAAQEDEGES